MDLRKDVLEDAVGFILQEEDTFKEALKDGKTKGYEVDVDYSGEFHESITDRSYTLQDAAYIIENCENEETDHGLWEGQQPEDALTIKAAYSYANDVREAMNSLFENELVEHYDAALEKLTERRDELERIDEEDEERPEDTDPDLTPELKAELGKLTDAGCEELAADHAFRLFRAENYDQPDPIEPGHPEEEGLLRQWLRLNANAGMWAGYPLGGSYIDARCGVGYGMPEIKDYVDHDQLVAHRCPHMRGADRAKVEKYLKKTFNK